MLSPPAGIHDAVGDQALWGQHPAGWLLRLSPGVDAAAETPSHWCFLAQIQGEVFRKVLGL